MSEDQEARARRAADEALMAPHGSAGDGVERLAAIMARLRGPGGCPWDREQSFESIAPYTIEEAYEVADAIERGDRTALCDELGDLLLQVVYHARIAEEEGAFALTDVCASVCDKMIRRHPHVFAGEDGWDWEAIKAAERAEKGEASAGVLDDVPLGLPALARARKLQKRAARVGFDWPDAGLVLDKVAEEAAELREAAAQPEQAEAVAEEFGDLLFVMVNLGRHLGVEAEDALRAANAKFTRRFAHIEARLREAGRTPEAASLDEMEAFWLEAKAAEKG